MKHVRSLNSEPSGLATYRKTWPAEELRPESEAKDVWEGFRNDPGYKQLVQVLADTQQGLCIYCEQRLVNANGELVSNDYQVEHVLPKSGGPARALDWKNLALACGGGTYHHHSDPARKYMGRSNTSCGQTKDNDDLPQACDPRGFPLLNPLVEVGTDGRISTNPERCANAGVKTADLSTAVDRMLNLNCERLRKERQDVGDNVRDWLVPILKEVLSGHLQPSQKLAMMEGLVAARLQPDDHRCVGRFWTAERCALGAAAELWLSKHQELFT